VDFSDPGITEVTGDTVSELPMHIDSALMTEAFIWGFIHLEYISTVCL